MSRVANKIIQAAAGVSGGYSGPLGLTSSIDSISGYRAGWRYRNIDISEYRGATVRPVFHYLSGTSYRGDIQIDDIQIDSTYAYSFEQSAHHSFQSNQTNSSVYTSVVWSTLYAGATAGRWNIDSYGTPSSGTGETSAADGTYYVYVETSGYSLKNSWLRGPEIVLPSDVSNMSYAEARLGANIGSLNVYLDITATA